MNRTRIEITMQILESANGYGNYHHKGATLTKLMCNILLGKNQLKEYLALLIEDDLLSYDSTICTFKTTEKGVTFVQGYNQINKMLKEQQI